MTTFSDNLRAARKMKGWSLQELADRVGTITKQSLNKYEQGLMKPEGTTLGLLAKALELTTDYFYRPNRLQLGQVEFRKKAKLTAKETDSIKEKIRDYLERYLEVEGLLNFQHHFNSPFKDDKGRLSKKKVATYDDVEDAAAYTLQAWKLGINPIPNVIEMLEENGICILALETSSSFHGLATHINDLPVIVLNKTDTPERRRFTALHELGHLVLDIATDNEKEAENFCHRFASAMLMPKEVVEREFGVERKRISTYELIAVKQQFGISVQAVMRRLHDLQVITAGHYKYFCIKISANRQEVGLGKYVGETNQSYRFQQLIHRLLAEDIVSDSKAANLAGMTLPEFRRELMPTNE